MFSKKMLYLSLFCFILVYLFYSKKQEHVISFSVPDQDISIEVSAIRCSKGYFVEFRFKENDSLKFNKIIDGLNSLECFYTQYSEIVFTSTGIIFPNSKYLEIKLKWGSWETTEFPWSKNLGLGYISTIITDHNHDGIPDTETMVVLQDGIIPYHPHYLIRKDTNFDGIFDTIHRKIGDPNSYYNPNYIYSEINYPVSIFVKKSKKKKIEVLRHFINLERLDCKSIMSFCLQSKDEELELYGAVLAGRVRHFSQIIEKIEVEKVIDLLVKNSDILLLQNDINKSLTDVLEVLNYLESAHLKGEESLLNSDSEYHYYRKLREKVKKQLDSKKH